MKNNFIKYSVIICLLSFTFVNTIKALPQNILVTPMGESLTLDLSNNLTVTSKVPVYEANYPFFYIKNSDSGRIICLSGLKFNAPGSGVSCSKAEWNNVEDGYAVGYISHLMGQGQTKETYYWQELLTLRYLGNLNEYGPGTNFYNYVLNSSKPILNTGKTFSQIVQDATNYSKTNFSTNITANGQKNLNLTFAKNDDGYYYSNEFKINSTQAYTLGNPDNSKFVVVKDADNYRFKIKSSDIELGTTESFKSVTTISKSYYWSEKYDCPGAYQDVSLAGYEEGTNSDSITITGSVTKDKTFIKISKVDEKNNSVIGAKFMLQNEEQKNSKQEGIIKTTDSNTNITFENLVKGKYYLTEVFTPEGYNINSNVVEIVIDAEGKVLVDNKEQKNGIIKISNTRTKTVISKKNAVNGDELPGATLELLDEKSEKMSCTIIDEKGNEKKLDECTWISGKEPVVIVGLLKGKYNLKETIAPEGYSLNTSIVEFEVKADGTVAEVEMINELEVEVPNTLSAKSTLLLCIAMFDIALGIGIVTYVRKNKTQE